MKKDSIMRCIIKKSTMMNLILLTNILLHLNIHMVLYQKIRGTFDTFTPTF